MVIDIAAYDVQGPCQAWSGLERGCVALLTCTTWGPAPKASDEFSTTLGRLKNIYCPSGPWSDRVTVIPANSLLVLAVVQPRWG